MKTIMTDIKDMKFILAKSKESKRYLDFVKFLEEKKIDKDTTNPKHFVCELRRLLYLFNKSPEETSKLYVQFPLIIVDMLPEKLAVEAMDFFTDNLVVSKR